eukprot:5953632-Prymnesium_polylepis.2
MLGAVVEQHDHGAGQQHGAAHLGRRRPRRGHAALGLERKAAAELHLGALVRRRRLERDVERPCAALGQSELRGRDGLRVGVGVGLRRPQLDAHERGTRRAERQLEGERFERVGCRLRVDVHARRGDARLGRFALEEHGAHVEHLGALDGGRARQRDARQHAQRNLEPVDAADGDAPLALLRDAAVGAPAVREGDGKIGGRRGVTDAAQHARVATRARLDGAAGALARHGVAHDVVVTRVERRRRHEQVGDALLELVERAAERR